MLRELDVELASASERTGRSLVWTAADRELLALIADTIDRKTDLTALYHAAEDIPTQVKLSAEVQLLEGSLARLLKMVQTDIPQPETMTTIKARRAARARWDKHATR